MANYAVIADHRAGIIKGGKLVASIKYISTLTTPYTAIADIGIGYGSVYPYDGVTQLVCNDIQAVAEQQGYAITYNYVDSRSDSDSSSSKPTSTETVKRISIGTQNKKKMIGPVKYYTGTATGTGVEAYIPMKRNPDGTVEGIDYLSPVHTFEVFAKKTAAEYTTAYQGVLFLLTGKLNAAAFDVYAAGQVLFLGADVEKKLTLVGGVSTYSYSCTYKFSAGPTIELVADTGLQIVDWATGAEGTPAYEIPVRWHDATWPEYSPFKVTEAQILRPAVGAVNVARVYEDGDFTQLELPDIEGGHGGGAL
jgi:hypothetical protein